MKTARSSRRAAPRAALPFRSDPPLIFLFGDASRFSGPLGCIGAHFAPLKPGFVITADAGQKLFAYLDGATIRALAHRLHGATGILRRCGGGHVDLASATSGTLTVRRTSFVPAPLSARVSVSGAWIILQLSTGSACAELRLTLDQAEALLFDLRRSIADAEAFK